MSWKEICSRTVEDTERAGADMAAYLSEHPEAPRFLAMYGNLGVGKTAFIRGFASVWTPGVAVRSPTFALVNEYRADGRSLFHFDVYRVTDDDDLYSTGYYDYFDRDGVMMTEWSENIPDALPERYWKVSIEKVFHEDGSTPDRRILIDEIHMDEGAVK